MNQVAEVSKLARYLEQEVSKALNVEASYLGHTDVSGEAPRSHAARVYAIYRFDLGLSESYKVFVKQGPNAIGSEMLEVFVSNLSDKAFYAPKFFGAPKIGAHRAAAWEYIKGASPGFENGTSYLQAIVEATAAINAYGAEAKACVPKLPIGSLFVKPVFERAVNFLDETADLNPKAKAATRTRLDAFGKIESHLIERIFEKEPRWLTHNDIAAANLILRPEDDRPVVIDWASSTLDPLPGASLRYLAWWDAPARRSAAELYSEKLNSLGHSVSIDDVLFGMETTQLFWSLGTGVVRNRAKRIVLGLAAWEQPKSNQRTGARQVKAISNAVETSMKEFIVSQKGKAYAPVPHPAFANVPAHHGAERFDLIEPYLEYKGGTALDIGAHWGFFTHKLEDLGYQVTAIENSQIHAAVLRELRDTAGKKFQVFEKSILDVTDAKYDVVLALNIFHHFLKKHRWFRGMVEFLQRLDAKMMIFETHNPAEGQMSNAYRNMPPLEFADFIAETARLPKIQKIAQEANGRILFKLSR